MPGARANERTIQPDLVLRIRKRTDGTTHHLKALLEVCNRDLGIEVRDHDFPPVTIKGKLDEVVEGHFEQLQDQELVTEEQKHLARLRLAALGVRLGELLLPESLRVLLWSLRHHKPAPSLLLLSNETWLPWELSRLREPDDAAPTIPMAQAEAGDGDDETEGRYLVEIFALTRWLGDRPRHLELPLCDLGLVVPDSGLRNAKAEKDGLTKLFPEAEELTARALPVLKALASAAHDALHFTGYGITDSRDPDHGGVDLDAGDVLRPGDLGDAARQMGRRHPWVFFNACHSARGLFALSGLGGFADAFLRAGAGAFLGTYWQVPDDRAKDFALAVYDYFARAGLPLGEAVRRARDWLSKTYPGDPTFLAYTAYGHPLALRDEGVSRWSMGNNLPLSIPRQDWTGDEDSPAGLLRAEHAIVPFHGRDRERDELDAWCTDDQKLAVRLLTGEGGMGKTRLLLEIARRREQDGWLAGFLTKGEADRAPAEAWAALVAREKPLFLVTDYAETRRDLVVPIVRGMLDLKADGDAPPVRLVLLARHGQDWWEQLQSEGEGVGDFLQGPATSHFSLQPLAAEPKDRVESYLIAAQKFSEVLGKPLPGTDPGPMREDRYERVLIIHMSALAAVEGESGDRDHIFDYILKRERRFWRQLAKERELPQGITRGLGRAMAAFTLGGGAKTQLEAVSSLRELAFFAAKDPQLLEDVARVLHDSYADDKQFIAPLQPDLLGEHLIHREMEQGADELIDLVFR